VLVFVRRSTLQQARTDNANVAGSVYVPPIEFSG
jgi:hypothetical protein